MKKRKITMPRFLVGEIAILDCEKYSEAHFEKGIYSDEKIGKIYDSSIMPIQVEIITAEFWGCNCSEYNQEHEDGSQEIETEGGLRYRVRFRNGESDDPRYDEAEVHESFLIQVRIRKEGDDL